MRILKCYLIGTERLCQIPEEAFGYAVVTLAILVFLWETVDEI